jgi:diguanylate cyclase (GGDEF)-like protein
VDRESGPDPSDTEPELRLIRARLLLCLGATAVMAAIIGGLIVVLLTPQHERLLPAAFEHISSTLMGLGLIAFAGAVSLVGVMVYRVLEPTTELARSRGEVRELYDVERLNALADSLTDLGNHRAFQEAFDRQLRHAQGQRSELTLVLIDLDDFKVVNDSAGHSVGDELLAEFGRLLGGAVRRGDQAFRVGGDEFAVILPTTTADQAQIVVRRLLATTTDIRPKGRFAKPFSFSAGIATTESSGFDRARLYADADATLYRVKRHGRTGVSIFDPRSPNKPGAAEGAVRSAAVAEVVQTRALHAVYQPLVDLVTGAVVGFEGLVRPLATAGFASAGELFEAAELAGRTYALDLACVDAVAAGAVALHDDQFLSVNLSPRTMEAPEFSAALLVRQLAAYRLRPDRVVLELTEREAVEDLDRLRSVLEACQAAGMRIAADDIGAGNAGLRLLSQIHFDIVKIDLSLVQAGSRGSGSLAVLKSLRDLAGQWGATAVAEGIESAEQLRLVRDLRFGEGQGYLLGRPGPDMSIRTISLDTLLASDPPPRWTTRVAAIAV